MDTVIPMLAFEKKFTDSFDESPNPASELLKKGLFSRNNLKLDLPLDIE